MSAERVAILLATYNGASYLPALLDSLSEQSHTGWTLLWRDDGSTDGTPELLRAFCARHGGIELAGQGQRLGVMENFLTLLRYAVGSSMFDRFAFCDQDDVWLPHKLDRALTHLRGVQGERPALYCARWVLTDAALSRVGEAPAVHTVGFPAPLAQNIATGCTIMLNPPAAALIGRAIPPRGSVHDWWAYIAVSSAGGTIIVDQEKVLLYRQHGGNTVGVSSFVGRLRNALQRGMGAFVTLLRAHVRSLLDQDIATAETRAILEHMSRQLQRGFAGRWRLIWMPEFRRQTVIDTLALRIWILLG